MIGTPIIIANVSRSRRICTNSFMRTAMKRCPLKQVSDTISPAGGRWGGGGEIVPDPFFGPGGLANVAHQVDEDILERRRPLVDLEAGPRGDLLDGALERRALGAAHVQRVAEGRHH